MTGHLDVLATAVQPGVEGVEGNSPGSGESGDASSPKNDPALGREHQADNFSK